MQIKEVVIVLEIAFKCTNRQSIIEKQFYNQMKL